MNWDGYGKGVIEPEALELPSNTDASVAFAFSAAVSLKRIADMLEGGDMAITMQNLIEEIRAVQTYGIKVVK